MTSDEWALDPDPLAQLELWLADARATGMTNPDAMALATADLSGRPAARFVLLRGLDARGLAFYTNYESDKARDLAENAVAAAVLYWADLGRQVRAAGTVERVSAEESARYFATRPIGHRLAAWASPQSRPVPSRGELDRLYSAAEERFPGGDVPVPPHWGGYRLVPTEMEFWESRENRMHDRLRFRRAGGGGWTVERLAP